MSEQSLQIVDRHGKPLTAAANAWHASGRQAKELRDWNPALGSADFDLSHELYNLVARSRDIQRNNGFASGAVQTLVDNIVGTGLRMQAKPDYQLLGWTKDQADQWAKQVESLWRTFADTHEIDAAGELDFATMTQLVYRCRLYNGEGLAAIRFLSQEPGRQWFTALQLIDPDRLSNPNNMMDTATLRQGVEINRRGAPIAYHIRETHPLDLPMMTMSARWQRVPARTRTGRRRMLHVFERDRVGQHRGVPVFASILSSFRMLDRYQRTELQTAVVNSLIAAFIETTASAEQLAQFFDLDFETYMNTRNQWEGSLEGGAVLQMPPGDKVSPFTPNRSATAFDSFVTSTLRHISTGLNMPYELLVKDFSKTNYSSARAALLEAWRHFNGRRKWLATHWAQPIYELWLEEAINRGFIEAPDFNTLRHAYTRARWIGPGRGWVDPTKEANAAKLRMETGVSTLEDECAEQGKDWEETLEQIAREEAKRAELGLTPSRTAQQMAESSQALGVRDSSEEEEDEGADDEETNNAGSTGAGGE